MLRTIFVLIVMTFSTHLYAAYPFGSSNEPSEIDKLKEDLKSCNSLQSHYFKKWENEHKNSLDTMIELSELSDYLIISLDNYIDFISNYPIIKSQAEYDSLRVMAQSHIDQAVKMNKMLTGFNKRQFSKKIDEFITAFNSRMAELANKN